MKLTQALAMGTIGMVLVTTAVFAFITRGLPFRYRILLLLTWGLEVPGMVIRFYLGLFFGGALVMMATAFTMAGDLLTLVFVASARGQENIMGMLPLLWLKAQGYGVMAVLIATAFAVVFAFYPLTMSALRLAGLRITNWYDVLSLGARSPSRRERERYTNILSRIAQKGMVVPDDIFVLDGLQERAFVIGRILYLERPLLHGSKNLGAIIAHYLGWMNSPGGRMVLALRSLTVPPVYMLSYFMGEIAPGAVSFRGIPMAGAVLQWIVTTALSLAGGGFGAFVFTPLWVMYFRHVSYEADAFAKAIGRKDQLISYLEIHQHWDVAVPWMAKPEPYTELRIDRLLD